MTATSPPTNCNLSLPHHPDMALVQIYGKEDFTLSNWSKDKVNTSKTPQNKGENRVAKRKLYSPGGAISEDEDKKVTPKRRKSLQAIDESPASTTTLTSCGGVAGRPGSTGPSPNVSATVAGGIGSTTKSNSSSSAGGKSATSATGGLLGTPRLHAPLSERQQMALFMQMAADEHQPGNDPHHHSPYSYQGSSTYRHAHPSLAGGHGPISPHSVGRRTPSGTNSGSSADRKLHKRNERGETPLHVAAIKGDVKMTKKLIKDGADVNVADYAGWTPLHEACNQGYPDVARQLIRAGANVNVRGLENDTPLHDAAVNGHAEIVLLLMDHGANPQQTNSKGKTPIDVCSNSEIGQILRRQLDGNGAPTGNHRLLQTSRNADSDEGTTSPPLSTSPNSVGSASPINSVTDSTSKKCGGPSMPAGTGNATTSGPQHSGAGAPVSSTCRPTNGTGSRKPNSSTACATTPPSASGVLKNVQVSHTMRGSQLMLKFQHVKRHENGSNSSSDKSSCPVPNGAVADAMSPSQLGDSAAAVPSSKASSSHNSNLSPNNNISPNASRKSTLCNGGLSPNSSSQHNKSAVCNKGAVDHESAAGVGDAAANHAQQWCKSRGVVSAVGQSSPVNASESTTTESTTSSHQPGDTRFSGSARDLEQPPTLATPFSPQFEDISDAEDDSPRPDSANRSLPLDGGAPSASIYQLPSLPKMAPLTTNLQTSVPPAEQCNVGSFYSAARGPYPPASLQMGPWNGVYGAQAINAHLPASHVSAQQTAPVIPPALSGARNSPAYFVPTHQPRLLTAAGVNNGPSLPVADTVDPYHLLNRAAYDTQSAKLPLDVRYSSLAQTAIKCEVSPQQTLSGTGVSRSQDGGDRDFLPEAKLEAAAVCSAVKSEVVVKVECPSAADSGYSNAGECKMEVSDDYHGNEMLTYKHESVVIPKSEPSADIDKEKPLTAFAQAGDVNFSDELKTETDASKCRSPALQLSPKTSSAVRDLDAQSCSSGSRPSTPVAASVLKVPPLRIIIPSKSTSSSSSSSSSSAADSVSCASVTASKAGGAGGSSLPYVLGGSTTTGQEMVAEKECNMDCRSNDEGDQVSDGASADQMALGGDLLAGMSKDEASAAANQYDSIVTRRRKTNKQPSSGKKDDEKSEHQSDTPSSSSTTSSDSKQRMCGSNFSESDDLVSARADEQDSSRLAGGSASGSERRVTRASARSQQQRGSAKDRANKSTTADSGHSSSRCEPEKDSTAGVPTDGAGASSGSTSGLCRSGTPPEDDSGPGSTSTIPRSKHKKLHRTATVPPPDPPSSDASAAPVSFHPFRKPTNPYAVYASIKTKIAERKNRLCCIVPKPPAHFSEYSLVKRCYVLHDGLATGQTSSIPSLTPPPASLVGPLRDVFMEQELVRHQLRLQHIKERERLILLHEQETLRVNCHAARASVDSSNSGVLSACSLLNIDEGLYGGGTTSIHGQFGGHAPGSLFSGTNDANSGHEDRDQRARFGTRHFVTWMQDVQVKFSKLKEDMGVRHQHEADVLCAVQRLDWEWKLRETGGVSSLSVDSASTLQTTTSSGGGSQSDDISNTNSLSATSALEIHVPLVLVDEDFNFQPL